MTRSVIGAMCARAKSHRLEDQMTVPTNLSNLREVAHAATLRIKELNQ